LTGLAFGHIYLENSSQIFPNFPKSKILRSSELMFGKAWAAQAELRRNKRLPNRPLKTERYLKPMKLSNNNVLLE
jgi:hypothetical protein